MKSSFTQKVFRVLTIGCITAIFAVAAFSQGNVSERGNGARGKHFPTVRLIQGNNGQLSVCAESNESLTGQYRLKVWQLMQGQTSEAAMASNRIIATASFHAINTKGTGANNNRTASTSESPAAAACDQPVSETPATEGQRTRSKSNSTNERIGVLVDGIPACAAGSTCDYVGAIELIIKEGEAVPARMASPTVFRFTISPDGIRVEM